MKEYGSSVRLLADEQFSNLMKRLEEILAYLLTYLCMDNTRQYGIWHRD